MKIVAKDINGKVISPFLARKGKKYFCETCNEEIHLREGLFRQKHFYHLNKTKLNNLHQLGGR